MTRGRNPARSMATFYERYDFTAVQTEGWPRRMFMPIGTARAALQEQATE